MSLWQVGQHNPQLISAVYEEGSGHEKDQSGETTCLPNTAALKCERVTTITTAPSLKENAFTNQAH